MVRCPPCHPEGQTRGHLQSLSRALVKTKCPRVSLYHPPTLLCSIHFSGTAADMADGRMVARAWSLRPAPIGKTMLGESCGSGVACVAPPRLMPLSVGSARAWPLRPAPIGAIPLTHWPGRLGLALKARSHVLDECSARAWPFKPKSHRQAALHRHQNNGARA